MDSSSLFFINLTAVVIRKGDLECCVLWCWLLTGAGGEMYFMNIVTESFSAWLPVCSVLNSAKLLRRAPASARYRSPAYLFRRGRSRCAKVNPITHIQWKLGVTHLYLEETWVLTLLETFGNYVRTQLNKIHDNNQVSFKHLMQKCYIQVITQLWSPVLF